MVVVALEHFVHCFNCFHWFQANNVFSANVASSKLPAGKWDFVGDDWHLLASGGSLVQGPGKYITSLVCSNDAENHRNEDG